MGYAKDLGMGIVHDICPVTGYPRDYYKHLLQTTDLYDGTVIPEWDKPGVELPNITSPYGHLYYATGSGDDFVCYDFEVINAGPRGMFAVLHSVVNSETGSFIQDYDYVVMPCNSIEQKREAVRCAFGLVDAAREWCDRNGIRHTVKGWKQSADFFAISIAEHLFPHEFKSKQWPSQTIVLHKGNAVARKRALALAFDKV